MRVEHIGLATLYHGDICEILPSLGRFDLIATDAPYGIADKPLTTKARVGRRSGGVATWHADSDWDKSIDPAWAKVCADAAPTVAWFGHWRKRLEVEMAMPHSIRAEIIWVKDTHVGPPCPLAMRDERIWIFSETAIKPARFETSVWEVPIIPTWARRDHKNEKPVALMARLLAWLNPSHLCDPFMGSGTTGVAAVNYGRSFVGIEQSAEHFETACRRIEDAQRQGQLFA